jgi:carbon storage regulator
LAFPRSWDYAWQTGVGGVAPVELSANRKVHRMLVLTRKSNQSIMIGDDVEVSVLSVMGEKVRIGIQAPQEIPVFRKEIYLEIHREDGTLDQEVRAEVNDALGELGEGS